MFPWTMMLTLTDVTIQRGPTRVVSGLDLVVRSGRVFWVVGPNGAGKSSLLRVMGLLDPPVSGRVGHQGAEQPLLYFHSEMALPRSSTVGAWARLVDTLLPEGSVREPTGLLPGLDRRRKVGRLSTGERKRLLLDALLRRPGSLLLDEPYEHLSPDARAALTRILEERSADSVVVVATNHWTERARQDGGLRLEGGAAEHYQPRSGQIPG